jgi:hypothetical protein
MDTTFDPPFSYNPHASGETVTYHPDLGHVYYKINLENNGGYQDAQSNENRESRLLGKVLRIKVAKMEDNLTAFKKWLKY